MLVETKRGVVMKLSEETMLILRTIVEYCDVPRTRRQIRRECKIPQECTLKAYLNELEGYEIVRCKDVSEREGSPTQYITAIKPFSHFQMLKNAEDDRSMRARHIKERHVKSDSFVTNWRGGVASIAGNSWAA